MEKDFDDRDFQFWHYHVSHGEALIRSPRDERNKKNIDLIFCGVEYIEVPRFLKNLKIVSTKDDDKNYLSERLKKEVREDRITVLMAGDSKFYVVSLKPRIEENELEMFELPFL